MNKHDNIYNILGKLASLEPQPPKQESVLKQLSESAKSPFKQTMENILAERYLAEKEVDEDMLTPKEKKFANLAPPKDKITYADKIVGAKKGDKKDVAEDADKQTMSRAAKGYEKYGKEGMEALAKAGKEGKDLDKVRDKYNKYDDDEKVNEGEYQDGPNKSDVPAFQRKAKAAPGDDSWKVNQQDLDDEASKSPTGSAGLAKAKARLGMNEQGEEEFDENNAHSSLPGTRRVTDEEHSEYDAAAHTVRKWMRKRGWDPKSEFKSACKYIMDNLDSTHDDTLTDEVKEACQCCARHHENIEEAGLDMNLLKGAQGAMKGVNTDPESERNSGKKYGYRNDRDDTGNDDDYDEHGNEKKGAKKSAPSDGPKTKGRPKKNFGPERTTAKAYKHKGSRVAEGINLETYVEDTMAEIEALFIVEKAKGKKPDFLDMDKDGNKKESMKKAVADKKGNPFGNKKDVKESKQQLTETTLQSIVRRFGKEVREFAEGAELDQDLFEALYDYYFDDMPYGVKKARDGDPHEWVSDHFHDAIQNGDVEVNETKVMHKELDELAALAGIAPPAAMAESACNMTAEGVYCPEHGVNECGMMYESADEKADKDYDGDGEVESGKDEVIGSRRKAAGLDDEDDEEKLDECGVPMSGMGDEAESGMNINSSMDTKTGRKTLTVTADGEAAEELAQMLRIAGLGGKQQPEHHRIQIAMPSGAHEVDEEYANEPDTKVASTDSILKQGNDLNKPKSQYKHSYRQGDNPMAMQEHTHIEARLARLLDQIK